MKTRPSRWWHVVSLLVFLTGAVGGPVFIVLLMLRHFSSGEEFFVPGKHVLQLQKPGKHIVWNVSSEFRDGRQYAFPDSLPAGTRIGIIDEASGEKIPTSATMQCSETSGNATRSSVCSFTIATPGSYAVVVDGMSEQRLLMVRPSMALKLILVFVVGGVVSVLGWILAPVISIIIEVRRYRAGKALANTASDGTALPPRL